MKRIIALCLLLTACTQEAPPPAPITNTFQYPLPDGAVLAPVQQQEVITENLLGSLQPDARTVQERVPDILARGRLIVGVEQSQNLVGFRNPVTGELEGFEVDLVREIARDIFGDASKVDFRYVDSNSWLRMIEAKEVDFVIRSLSITRQRQDQVFFSTPYYTARTRLLTNTYSDIASPEDLAGKTVCAAAGSTGQQRVTTAKNLLLVRGSSDCLLALQQGQVDAVISDDSILSGMRAQDPSTKIVGEVLAVEDYGIAFGKPGARHNTDGLIRQVNATLERVFRDGTWRASYDRWFGAYLPAQQPPLLNYRSEQ
ncbi:glutamate ABC transporter substrate-binding protein [Corynebacterium kozikiae]|uniref:glutamate ABC transporter substrate-binding protein n=1 Tax=Corynebacterium kozikiae TaxID=2968469 RepID=UPI00211CE360|nr:glutamate ABC transporter substrate-binding protein [Corynebacterium sp. 76QC2CO]MCQ9343727.1 glutamate ABC transporter substrate-binding protein [Corynebacterium sp. 76QC2CO]